MGDRRFFGLAPQRCYRYGCQRPPSLILCDACKVVSYCSPEHQSADRRNHLNICNAIKTTQQTLAKEEAVLRATPGDFGIPEDLFATRAGDFWTLHDTRDYMRARFAVAEALLKANTFLSVEQALGHLKYMLRLDHSDSMGLRDIVPGLMLRLGQEQECYDFLTWWAVFGDFGWADENHPPYIGIRNSDALERFEASAFPPGSFKLSLSQFVTLTLLKLRLLVDLRSVEARWHNNAIRATYWGGADDDTDADGDHLSDDEVFDLNRLLGKLVKARVRQYGKSSAHVAKLIEQAEEQYHELIEIVQNMNPHFWTTLIEETTFIEDETPSPPANFTKGSREEAHSIVHQCKAAWEESGFALEKIDADTTKYVALYTSPSTDVVAEDLPVIRGTGRAFASVFKPPTPKTTPEDLFILNPLARGAKIRFHHRNNPNTVILYAGGACLNNGQAEPRAGWAVAYGPENVASGRLEEQGPFADKSTPTSNRAELRAAIAALRLCNWRAGGVDNIIIATDSSYVVDGATHWAEGWLRKDWKTRAGEDVKNRDLWELLLGEVEKWKDGGLTVKLWKLPRELNTEAGNAAKAAADAEPIEEFRDMAIAPASAAQDADNRVLLLCLEDEYLFNAVHEDLLEKVTTKAKVDNVTKLQNAIEVLAHDDAPSIILVTDTAITHHQKLFECVADRLRAGATVVLCGQFSSLVTEGQFSRLFARLGLPWARSAYYRETVTLRRDAVGSHFSSKLPMAYSQKALFVKGLEKSDAWYTEAKSSTQAAVAFVKVGYGRLGYIGDANGEEKTTSVVLAMCGLLD